MSRFLAVVVFVICTHSLAFAQATTVFQGRPSVKISESGTERVPQSLSRDQAVNLECVISKIGNDYYWVTRENKRMVRIEGAGAFITYQAIDGSGYVRVIKPGMKQVAALASETEAKFDYVEHLLIGLASVTYYGGSK